MMVSFRTGLYEFLLEQSALTALVGERVYPSVLPDKPTFPSVVYQVISNEQTFTHDGPVALRRPRVQIDVWSRRRLEAEAIESAIISALVGYRGPMGDVDYTAGWGLEISTDIYEQETLLHRISMDFRGWYGTEEGGTS